MYRGASDFRLSQILEDESVQCLLAENTESPIQHVLHVRVSQLAYKPCAAALCEVLTENAAMHCLICDSLILLRDPDAV